MRRREFITLLGGAATWPLAARAQQGDQVRRIGVLMQLAEDDPQSRAEVAAFLQALQELGWSEGRNLRIYPGGGGGAANRIRKSAGKLATPPPKVVLAPGGIVVGGLQQAS